jgi:hypothetical protein
VSEAASMDPAPQLISDQFKVMKDDISAGQEAMKNAKSAGQDKIRMTSKSKLKMR